MQITKLIYLDTLDTMKKVLDLAKFKLGKDTEDFKFFKEKVMDSFYNNLKKLFKSFESEKLATKCPNKCNIRKGFSKCDCGGSGYIMKDTPLKKGLK